LSSNVQKTPLARSLEQFANRKVAGAIQLLGKALPAEVTAVAGSIVTVKFLITSPYTLPQIQVPLAGCEYARPPTQFGDTGVVFPADAFIGAVSGLGAGTADLTQPAPLAALTFFPIGSKNFSPTDDPNAYVIYGPDGAIIRDSAKTNVLTVSQNEVTLTLKAGSFIVTLPAGLPMIINGNLQINGGLALSGRITAPDGTSTYAENIETSGDVITGVGTGNQISSQDHTHLYDSPSGDEQTGPPTAGT
jgi:hypothetical protein